MWGMGSVGWYRKWSDSLLQQGSRNPVNNTTINFLIPFSNTSYCFLRSLDWGSGTVLWAEAGTNINNNKKVNSVSVGTRIGDWFAMGY